MNTPQLTVFLLLSVCITNSKAAVHLSTTDTGSAIIVPFYTVSNQMNTLLSLNNSTDDNKAVKIHFKEAKSGDLLASFNVYLTGQDMWTMGMGQVPSINGGRLRMVSDDQSCTIGFPNNEDLAIGGDWLWENGTIEIIEMGTVGDIEAWQTMENDCEAIAGYWNDNQMWANNSEDQMSSATGGLHAEVTLMDVEQGHSANIPIIHMDGFYGEDNIQHTPAGDESPNLSTGTKDSMILLDGEAIKTTWLSGYEAVSALLMKTTLVNEFNLEPEVAAQTEWIISLPTLHYHRLSEEGISKPFSSGLVDRGTFWFPTIYSNTVYFNREGQFEHHFPCTVCSPTLPETQGHSVINLVIYQNTHFQHPGTPSLRPTPMLSLNAYDRNTRFISASYLSEHDSTGLNWIFNNGKIKLELSPNSYTSTDRGHKTNNEEILHTFYGMPVVGFSYTKFSNANAQPGLLAQYAFIRKHYGTKKVEISEE